MCDRAFEALTFSSVQLFHVVIDFRSCSCPCPITNCKLSLAIFMFNLWITVDACSSLNGGSHCCSLTCTQLLSSRGSCLGGCLTVDRLADLLLESCSVHVSWQLDFSFIEPPTCCFQFALSVRVSGQLNVSIIEPPAC